MRRPEKHFWYFVALMSTVLLLGLSGQLISCAQANPHAGHFAPAPPAYPIHHDPPSAPWNQPGPTVTSGPGVTLNAHLDRGAVLQHGDGIVRVEVEIRTEIAPGTVAMRESDIIVVVDTSGSMEGEKIHFARQALYELFARLGPGDRFGLVEYSDSARVLIPLQPAGESQKEHFRSVASNLTAQGSTNMSSGLDSAAALLRQENRWGRPARVLLLSDGLANAGDASLSGLTQRARTISHDNVALTTMGIGADFDENLMTHLATAGTGAFYYLANLSYLSEFFENELSSTRETYASAAEVVFEPTGGASLIQAMGMPIERRGRLEVVRLGSLYGGRARTLWLTFRVPTSSLGAKHLGGLSLSYQRQGKPGMVSVGHLPPVACVNDYIQYQNEIRQAVWERAVLGDVFTTTQEQFGDAIRTGDRQQLKAAIATADRERQLAQKLGNQAVLKKFDQLQQEAKVAEQAQSAPAPVRNESAKRSKARGYQMRNSDVYKDSAAAMEAY